MALEPKAADKDNTAVGTERKTELKTQVQEEQKTMFELELKLPISVEEVQTWADRTCISKRSLNRFLNTLTPSQLAQAEVIVDEDSYIVFYPVLNVGAVGPHFDEGLSGGSPLEAETQPTLKAELECSSAQNRSADFNELSQDDWDRALSILLSSVKLI